jgi:hypothetical protein
MPSKTTRLDPRTNDPYINKNGRLELASDKEEILQRFDVMAHTQVGTCPLNISYGIDYDWIKRQDMSPDNAFLLELIRRIEEKVEPLLGSFDVVSISEIGNSIGVQLTIRGTNDLSSDASVIIS